MRNNIKAQFMLCFVALTLIITNLFSLNVNAETQVKRLAGQGRYETAKAVTSQWDKSEYAVLVTGADYPDALSATPLAKKYDAPILLTEKNKLNNNTLSEIKRLGVKKVFIVGGRGAVGTQVESELKKQNISIERLGGAGRYETSVEVAKKLENTEEAFIVTGTDFTDALTVAPIAAKKGAPIILSPSGNINNAVKKYLEQVSKTYVIGGIKEINEVVYKQLPSPERISGANKYERNINVINKFVDNKENVYVATGANYPDALAGSALAAKNNSYILLVEENINNSTLNFVKEDRFNTITLLGGTGVVSERIANIVKTGEFIKPIEEQPNNKNEKLTENEAVKLVVNKIKHKFNKFSVMCTGNTKDYFNIEVFEDMGAHITNLGRYRVDSETRQIYEYNLIKNSYTLMP